MPTDIIGFVTSSFSGSGIMNYIIWAIGILVVVGAVAGGWFLIRYLLSFDIKIQLLYPTSTGYIIKRDMAREKRDESGNTKWQFLKTKGIKNRPLKVLPPSAEYIDMTKKGKRFCRFEMVDSDSPIPIHPKVKDPNDDTIKDCTLSVEERASMIHDIHETEMKYKDKSIMKLLERALPIITVVITVLMLVIFLNTFADTQASVASDNSKTTELLVKAIEKSNQMQETMIDMQRTMLSYISSGEVTPYPTPQPP